MPRSIFAHGYLCPDKNNEKDGISSQKFNIFFVTKNVFVFRVSRSIK
ncbi:hypothetical protein HMPREF7215_0573 [Pyramidobacter piscolens W5455]|uniref:Uncharacterized protein n=1 Tax=Pyramidobacter piscolens W5455 TaxID=352165 RepID=A0ABM9ZUW6_9BACT|nr:hypothetical protein HMPREF7215_0573 [Pyramidobacter piscolens W5455]